MKIMTRKAIQNQQMTLFLKTSERKRKRRRTWRWRKTLKASESNEKRSANFPERSITGSSSKRF